MDWDAAYSNVDHVADSASFPPRWAEQAAAFRSGIGPRGELDIAYGTRERELFDLFQPANPPKGLAVFVHGGYWRRLDRSLFSQVAAGPIARGWAVAVMGYTLCPEIRVSEITRQVRAGLMKAAGHVPGPITLAGHSAGGHLVTRMMCTDVDLPDDVAGRIKGVLSISGVHDLRPLLKTEMNQVLGLDETEAKAESPVLATPRTSIPVTCVVGAEELDEFRRQNALLANIWTGMGVDTFARESTGTHHFSVIEELTDPDGRLVADWVRA